MAEATRQVRRAQVVVAHAPEGLGARAYSWTRMGCIGCVPEVKLNWIATGCRLLALMTRIRTVFRCSASDLGRGADLRGPPVVDIPHRATP